MQLAASCGVTVFILRQHAEVVFSSAYPMSKPNPVTPKQNASHPLFESNKGLWESVMPTLHKKHFDSHTHVLFHGDEATHLWLVYHGWVKLSRQTPDGKETIIGLCTGGDVFGEAALFTGANYPYTAEILGDGAEIASIPAASIRTAISNDSHISSNIMSMMSERMSQAQLKLEHMSTMTAAQRLGCFLLKLCHTQAEGAKTLHIPIEKNILAMYLGMKPETLSRSQQQLKPLGITVSGANIAINDISRLREFVCNSCSESGSCDIEDCAD
jgi:CRP/FNR family transcriptional regulator, dissimilatory nitrate respiration regulator